MRIFLEYIINDIQRYEMEAMFGDGSNVIVHTFIYSTNYKKFYVDATINITEIDEIMFDELYPYGLKLLIIDAIKYFGINDTIVITTRFNLI